MAPSKEGMRFALLRWNCKNAATKSTLNWLVYCRRNDEKISVQETNRQGYDGEREGETFAPIQCESSGEKAKDAELNPTQ